MFTGITTDIVQVQKVIPKENGVELELTRPGKISLSAGQSVSLDGICTTVMRNKKKSFAVELMPETLRKTTASKFQVGRRLNFESSLTLRDLVDGHLVQGHVDGVAKVKRVTRAKRDWRVTLSLPRKFSRYIARHGSIAINGVSLTVARREKNECTVALIPYTLNKTNLGDLAQNDQVNIEVDIVARYVEQLVKH